MSSIAAGTSRKGANAGSFVAIPDRADAVVYNAPLWSRQWWRETFHRVYPSAAADADPNN